MCVQMHVTVTCNACNIRDRERLTPVTLEYTSALSVQDPYMFYVQHATCEWYVPCMTDVSDLCHVLCVQCVYVSGYVRVCPM